MSDNEITARLEYLRGEIRAERISYGELAELQSLAGHIESGDTELLEPAGVPEHEDETATDPAGVVHQLADRQSTVCGENATGWSRAVTQLQRLGLVLFCDACYGGQS